MSIHKEGHLILGISLLILTGFVLLLSLGFNLQWTWSVVPALILFGLLLQFFRKPTRHVPSKEPGLLYAPADGKIVVMEQSKNPDMPGENCIQISIFMSPLNVHINWAPTGANVIRHRYHPGKYLMAWNPKSSEENEQYTSVWKTPGGQIFVLKQIAGFMARRIIPYVEEGKRFEQGEEIGFIRFGSRVDVLLPLDAEIQVRKGDNVKGKQTVIARLTDS